MRKKEEQTKKNDMKKKIKCKFCDMTRFYRVTS